MAKRKISPEFQRKLSEKLMDLGNLVAAALIFGQFISDKEFSMILFFTGILITVSFYIASYIVSS